MSLNSGEQLIPVSVKPLCWEQHLAVTRKLNTRWPTGYGQVWYWYPPLIQGEQSGEIFQKWYADYGSAVGKLEKLKHFLDGSLHTEKAFAYLVNEPKCQLVVEEAKLSYARKLFAGTAVEITTGTRFLSSVIGDNNACYPFLNQTIDTHSMLLQKLSKYVKTSPQNAYSCFTRGFQQKINFVNRTTHQTSKVMKKSN